MSRVSVLHFTSNAAAGNYFPAVAKYYDRDRFRLVIGTLSGNGPLHERLAHEGIEYFALNCSDSRRGYAVATARLLAWLKNEHIDVVQTHLYHATFVGLLAARLIGVPVRILTTHHTNDSYLHYRLRAKRVAFFQDRFASRHLANRIIAVSGDVRQTVERHHGIAAFRIAQIPYGFDFTQWTASVDARDRLRSELNLRDAFVFGSVGRLNWIKDFGALLRAFAVVYRQHRNARLVIVGDGDERAQLAAQARALDVADCVIFTGYRNDIPDLLSAMDVFVSSSLTEACNQAIVEALAMARFVIATRVGAAPEQIVDRQTGILVPPGDADRLAVAMMEAMALAHVAPLATGAARARRMSAKSMVEAYEAAYMRWLGEVRSDGARLPNESATAVSDPKSA